MGFVSCLEFFVGAPFPFVPLVEWVLVGTGTMGNGDKVHFGFTLFAGMTTLCLLLVIMMLVMMVMMSTAQALYKQINHL
jgi:hypothetical protein